MVNQQHLSHFALGTNNKGSRNTVFFRKFNEDGTFTKIYNKITINVQN